MVTKKQYAGDYSDETARLLGIIQHKIEVTENRLAGKWEDVEASLSNQLISIPKFNQR